VSAVIPFLREALGYGRRLGLVDREASKGSVYTLEIGAKQPEFILHDRSEVFLLPMAVDRSSNTEMPNALYDNLKYLLLRERSRKAFWEATTGIAREVGDLQVIEAIDRVKDKLLECRWKVTREVGGNQFWTISLGRNELIRDVPESAWIVLAFEGTPLMDMQAFKTWWSKRFARLASDDDASGEDIDFLTGKACMPVKTHTRVKGFAGVGGKTAVTSYNYPTCTYDSDAGGQARRNFPVSRSTDKLYTRGLNHAGKAALNDDLTLVIWPAEGETEHPIVEATLGIMAGPRFLDGDTVKAHWDTLAGVSIDDATPMVLAMMQGSRARLGLLEHAKIEAGQLKRNLLRFQGEFGGRSSLLFSRTTWIPEFDGKQAKNSLRTPQIHRLAWAVLVGSTISEAFVMRFARFAKRADIDEPEGRGLFTRCMAWMQMIQARKEGKTIMSSETLFDPARKPDLQSFCPDALTGGEAFNQDRAAYNFGRLVAVFCSLYFQYHRRMAGTQELRRSARPRRWLANRSRVAQVYIEKFIRRRWDRHLEGLFEAISVQLGSWSPVAMTLKERADHTAGFFAQQAYNKAYRDWASAERERGKTSPSSQAAE
jgi:hypothetical protein